uniref:RRP15-like protein n=1 Tax=Propithecus coquereli TaxID=379532 RepID=A0A2K6EJX8_PROCO
MAAAVQDSHVNAGEKLKKSPKKKMKMEARAIASELEDEVKDASDSEGSCELEKDHFSSDDEAIEADNEDDVEPYNENENTAESNVETNMGWANAMAKILNKKIPVGRRAILIKNKALEKEKLKLKEERLEKRKQRDKRLEWEMMRRVKPDVVKDKETERNLQRIATTEVKSEEGPGWTILRDDFMMGASMKDWDKESDK